MTKDVQKLVTFKLAEDLFALPVEGVEAVLRYSHAEAWCPTPNRGLRAWSSRTAASSPSSTSVAADSAPRPRINGSPERRIILLRTAMGLIGLVVDAVLDVIEHDDGIGD